MVSDGSDDAGPNLNLTPDERQLYGQLFRQADTESVGIVMGEVAVKFFEKTHLDSRILGEIWQIADSENRGFLTPAGFGIALRLIGHAQAGREPGPTLALQQGPLPRFEGVPAPVSALPLVQHVTGGPGPLSAQATGGMPQLVAQGTGSVRVPPLTIDKAAQYAKLFREQVQGGSILPGERAKRIFERSGLPNDVLGRIWQLADTEQRGAFVQTEFIIAMHLLTSTKLGTLRGLPSALPAALYDAATRGANAVVAGGAPLTSPASPVWQQSPLGGTPGVPPLPPLPASVQRQTAGQFRPALPTAPPPASDWLITPAEKSRMDPVFDSLDKTKKGFITGEEAVPFLTRSGLNEDALAQIWDLADVNSEGRLTSDTFAVALYLIQQQRQRTDGGSALPTKLPASLIPPSMRSSALRPTSPAAVQPQVLQPPPQRQQPPPPPPPPPQHKSALDDLFGLDSGPSSPSATPALTANVTGAGAGVGSALSDPFSGGGGVSPLPPSSPSRKSPVPAPSSFKPFIPSSSFGRALTAQATGDSSGSAPSSFSKPMTAMAPAPVPRPYSATPPAAQDDLLGGDNDEASRNISNDTAELANLSNQVGSLSKHMQEVQTHRTTLQTDLAQSSQQKKNFEQRLAQLRNLYEKEAQDVRGLEEQLSIARSEAKKLQAELLTLESSLQEMQSQHQQVYSALQADQQENGSLKGRIATVTAEVSQLKPQIEKLKSEARQQKGIVAINRKQLSLAESEREKLKTEAEDLTRQNEELSRQIQATAATTSNVPSTTASPSVASSTGKNPFFRRTGSTDVMGVFGSPRAQSESPKPFSGERSFDDVFGPPPTAVATAIPAVPGAFQPQTTGASSGSGASSTFTATTALSGPTSATATPVVSRQATFAGETAEGSAASEAPTTEALQNGDGPAASTGSIPAAAAATAAAVTAGIAGIAGFAGFGNSASESTPTGSTTADSEAKETNVVWGHAHNDSLSDPFSSLDKQQDSKAKEDFESAFASFKASKTSADEGDAVFASPTDRTATPPTTTTTETATATAATAATASKSSSSSDVVNTDAAKATTAFDSEFPPIAEVTRDDESESESESGGFGGGFDDDFAPASPPKANEAGKAKGSAAAVPEAKAVSSDAAPDPFSTSSNMDDIFGGASSVAVAPTVSAAATAPATEAEPSFDDLDDEFEGLEDAREESADDDFANISQTTNTFPSAFDSPQQPGKLDATSSNFGLDSSFDFGSLGSSTQNGSSQAAATTTSDTNNDWFTSFTDAPAKEAKEAKEAKTATAAVGSGAETLTRPPGPGRLLTEDGEHDDPFLKKLTSMGYPRALALNALEKYDYNVDRAANFLASQS